MFDNGSLQVRLGGTTLWRVQPGGPNDPLHFPPAPPCSPSPPAGPPWSDHLEPGQCLPLTQVIEPNGEYRLVPFENGNLEPYHVPTNEKLWESGTAGAGIGPGGMVMQFDGNFVIYPAQGEAWATGTLTPGSIIKVQDDGNLVVYRPDDTPAWDRHNGLLP